MRYSVNLSEDKRNCFAEKYWIETNNYEILKEEPFNNVLFEHEYEDIQWEDLHEVDGEIQLNEGKYWARKGDAAIELLRSRRAPMLVALDIWKSNVNVGFLSSSDDELTQVKEWYLAILDLDEEALNNVPDCIKKYM